MEPLRLRMLIMTAILLVLFLFLTIGFGAMAHVSVDVRATINGNLDYSYKYKYGYFRYCYDVIQDGGNTHKKDCDSVDYDKLVAPLPKPKDSDDSSGAKADIAVAVLSYVAVLACCGFMVLNLWLKLSPITTYIQCGVLAVASIAAIIVDSLYTSRITDAWDQLHNDDKAMDTPPSDLTAAPSGQAGLSFSSQYSSSVGTGWAFSMYVGASVVMVIQAGVTAFITRRYSSLYVSH